MEVKQVLSVATDVSGYMLKFGGEVYRAEESAHYICKAYGIQEVDVFAISSSIVVTVSHDDDFITKTRRILNGEVDLTKVDRLNALSRQICETTPSYEEIQAQLQEIRAIAPYSPLVRVGAMAVISATFALLFGCSVWEGISAAVVGLVAGATQVALSQRKANPFLCTTFCSFLMSALSFGAMAVTGGALQAQNILVGTLMVLVPGLALTNCMRDLMANDYLAGVTKFVEAMMTALAIALGVAMVILGVYSA